MRKTMIWLLWVLVSFSVSTATPTGDSQQNSTAERALPTLQIQIQEALNRELESIKSSLHTEILLEEFIKKVNILEEELKEKSHHYEAVITKLENDEAVITKLESEVSKLQNTSKELQLQVQQCEDNNLKILRHAMVQEALETPSTINFQFKGNPNSNEEIQRIIPGGDFSSFHNLFKLLVSSSCYDWRKKGFSESGYYMIDPDGVGIGQPPITVFCEMTTGFTFVHHDHEGLQQAEPCSGPGCYSRNINYEATQEQIVALMKRSQSCQQFLRLDCRQTPLKTQTQLVAWWADRFGNKHYHWVGDDDDTNTCACGLSGGCVHPNQVCNCNANLGNVSVTDKGYLNSTALPVTQLLFGDTYGNDKELKYTLGPLRCFGSKPPEVPESCEDLLMSGISQSAYHFIGKESNIKLQYCNMEKPDSELHPPVLQLNSLMDDMKATQTSISTINKNLTSINVDLDLQLNSLEHMMASISTINNNLTSMHVYLNRARLNVIFNAVRESSKTDTGPVIYDTVTLNNGNGYNPTTGMFTAPIDGVYFFSTSNRKASEQYARISLRRNDEVFARSFSDENIEYDTLSANGITKLSQGDKVHVNLEDGIIDSGYHPSRIFLGVLLFA